MPSRKKKVLKRKKKSIVSKSFSKRDVQRGKNEEKTGGTSNYLKKSSTNKSEHVEKIVTKRRRSSFKVPIDITTKVNLTPGKKSINYQSMYRPDGLSPKEKSYVICSCQARASRYKTLKNLAATAIQECKIFSIYGQCNPVRVALLERGWVEKIAPNKMNLARIKNGTLTSKPEVHGELERLLLSNLVEKYPSNFIWRTREDLRDFTIDMTKECTAIVNKLKTDALWTSKQGLCSSMKRNYWFYIEDVAEVTGPRSYNTYDPGEIEGFIRDYKITACTSLLKWVVSMVANERPVFIESGKIPMNVVLFALNRCKEYLFRKQNKDIDRSIANVTSNQWNSFLKKYYRIISKDEVFQADTENKLPLYLGYAKFLLKEVHRYRPQLSCEGCHNIWIIKPSHMSRGRGIRLASRLGVITSLLTKTNNKYVIQKYIEEPLLIHETKFDIRQYCLVTSTYPLVIWMYRDCYLKFSSQKYSLNNYHESIHLTNNAVQRKYTNCAGRHEELPPANMWDLDKYKEYLNRIDKGKAWDKIIYPGMKKSIIGIMLSCQDSLPACKNRFELYGCDFILDKEYKPWLIEINASPDLNPTTPVTAKICPAVLTDVIKVIIDHASNSKSPTGKFECIYRQPMTTPRYGMALDLYVRGYSLPNEYFYKGNIEIKESFDDVDIEKEKNIKAIMGKIKEDLDTIMVTPEDDTDSALKKEQETTTRLSRSEYELSIAATVVTGQLEELIDRITSGKCLTVKSKHEKELPLALVKPVLTPARSVKSVTHFESILQKSLSQFTSKEAINLSKKSSLLDISPANKENVGLKFTNRLFSEFKHASPLKNHNEKKEVRDESNPLSSQDIIIEATAKLIKFINLKEKEYLDGNFKA